MRLAQHLRLAAQDEIEGIRRIAGLDDDLPRWRLLEPGEPRDRAQLPLAALREERHRGEHARPVLRGWPTVPRTIQQRFEVIACCSSRASSRHSAPFVLRASCWAGERDSIMRVEPAPD